MFAKLEFTGTLKKFSAPFIPIGPLYPRNTKNSNYRWPGDLHANFCRPNFDEKLKKNQLDRLWQRQLRAA